MLKIQKIYLFVVCFILLLSSAKVSFAEQYGPVKSGDVLWTIAGKTRPDRSVSLHQMLIALLKENPNAFRQPCNFNTLKIGKTLSVPPLEKIKAISQADAVTEFARQNEQWRNRQQGITCSTLLEQDSQKQAVENVEKPTVATAEEAKTTATPLEETPPVGATDTPPVKEKIADTDSTGTPPVKEKIAGTVETPESLNETVATPTQTDTTVNESVEKPLDSTEKPVALPAEETASIYGEITGGSKAAPAVRDTTLAIATLPSHLPVIEEEISAQPAETNTPEEPVKITESIEEKTGFSLVTVASAVLIAVLILGLLAWLAFREKANKSSLRKKTEQAVLSNQYDKMNNNDKAGDTDAGLDLFAETLTDITEQRRTQ